MLIGLGTQLVARAALWATRLFYDVSRIGPPLPGGPVLVVANHPNSIVDALVVFCVAGRRVHPLARAPLFERPVIGQVLRELGGLPVYRPQDDPARVGENEQTFDAAIAALRGGAAVLIFPEGISHSEPELAPLRTGAARIALRAEADHNGTLGLRIVPVGLTYRRKTVFRGEAAAYVGAPLEPGAWRAGCEAGEPDAVRRVTRTIAAALETVVVAYSGRDNEPLLHAAEAMYHAEHAAAAGGRMEPEELARRIPRLQTFAAGMAWLEAGDPARLAQLRRAVRRLAQQLARLGLEPGSLPTVARARDTVRVLGADALLVVVSAPFLLLGIVAWYVPYVLPRLVVRLQRPAYEALATVKLVSALVAFPLAYAAWIACAAQRGGAWAAGVVALLLPVAGVVALYGREHGREFRSGLLFRLRTVVRPGLADYLRLQRRAIVREIDAIADEWDTERRRR